MSTNSPLRCRALIDRGAIRANLVRLRDRLDPAGPFIAMVKADAYGLGTRNVVPVLRQAGVRCFGVASASEAHALRDEGVKDRIIVFGPFGPKMEREVVSAGAEATVSSIAEVERFAAAGAKASVPLHVEIDTGMGRAGFPATELDRWAPDLREALSHPGVTWAGVFTHLHSADEPGRPGSAEQLSAFETALARLDAPAHVERHIANSGGAFWDELPDGAGARPGIYLYGGEVEGAPRPDLVLTLEAAIVRVADVPAGATVGYGATHAASAASRWATAAIGYGDGLPRALSNRGRALIHGRPAPIIGRVSMDLTVLDVTGRDDVRPGDRATFIGRDGGAEIQVEEVAAHTDTISYEILTRLTPRVPRIPILRPRSR